MILNNNIIINFINDKIKLELESFIKIIGSGVIIECDILRLLIVGYNTRVFKGIFN